MRVAPAGGGTSSPQHAVMQKAVLMTEPRSAAGARSEV